VDDWPAPASMVSSDGCTRSTFAFLAVSSIFCGLPMARVCPTNTNADWTKTKSRPRHWFTRTGLTNGRHAKLHATLPMATWMEAASSTETPLAAAVHQGLTIAH
jgi:hypothetical protein